MPHVTVVFARRHHLGSLALRTWMHSRFSHCALLDPSKGTVIEAVVSGVRERPLEDLVHEASRYDFVKVPCRNPQKVIDAARDQIGKPYDWRAIFGFWFRRSWHRTDAFICSELVAWALSAGGDPVVRREAYRVSPEALYLPLWERSGI